MPYIVNQLTLRPMPKRKVNKEKKEKLGHIIAAFIILVHAYEKYDLGESSYIFFLIAGMLFLSIALLHHHIVKRFPYTDGFFFVIEASLYVVVAADYFHRGKKRAAMCYIAMAIAYIIAAFIKGKKGKAMHNNALKATMDKKDEEE